MLIDILLLIAGLIVLTIGAEGLVRGSSSLAAKLRISPLVIGLTVVSFGTSAPELAVNLSAAFEGSTDLAIGNVVGSNIANILLILGISAMIVPLSVKSSTVWKEIPLALLGVTLIFIMGHDRLFDGVSYDALTRTDGLALIALMIIFMYYVFDLAQRSRKDEEEITEVGEDVKVYPIGASAILTLLGLGGLVVGGRMLVDGASGIASAAGLSEALIGLTVVAIGTSLPELATSVVAALRRQADIAIGNAVGSNIFNVFFVLGTTSIITPLPFGTHLSIDVIVSILATTLLFICMFVGGRLRLERWQGLVFVSIYVAYIVYAVLRG